MIRRASIAGFDVGPGSPLLVIAGPCVLESAGLHDEVAGHLSEVCGRLGLRLIFKGSFDKANRSSIHSARGPGQEAGLAELARVRDVHSVAVTTDIHEPGQAAPAAAAVDLLQIPAFLSRQTDLLVACGRSGRPVNVKKGQFMAPEEMRHVVTKLREAGAEQIMLTERGTFFGYHRLVNDFIGLGDMMALGATMGVEPGPAVCFDVTHSTQLPGAGRDTTAGRPERAGLLARAAVAAGVDAVFIETHPEPAKAASDASTVQPLSAMGPLLESLAALRAAVGEHPAASAAQP